MKQISKYKRISLLPNKDKCIKNFFNRSSQQTKEFNIFTATSFNHFEFEQPDKYSSDLNFIDLNIVKRNILAWENYVKLVYCNNNIDNFNIIIKIFASIFLKTIDPTKGNLGFIPVIISHKSRKNSKYTDPALKLFTTILGRYYKEVIDISEVFSSKQSIQKVDFIDTLLMCVKDKVNITSKIQLKKITNLVDLGKHSYYIDSKNNLEVNKVMNIILHIQGNNTAITSKLSDNTKFCLIPLADNSSEADELVKQLSFNDSGDSLIYYFMLYLQSNNNVGYDNTDEAPTIIVDKLTEVSKICSVDTKDVDLTVVKWLRLRLQDKEVKFNNNKPVKKNMWAIGDVYKDYANYLTTNKLEKEKLTNIMLGKQIRRLFIDKENTSTRTSSVKCYYIDNGAFK